mmetsp:Transcript_66994/g.155494  ORF Transcript_66994/g.155494 Transcript_66994/m.155494 type:complete len:424 (+) Transcript_66994:95-1366(+)
MGMESELRCPVCSEYFVDPVMLQCTHHICAQHIGSLVVRDRISCPVCGDVTALPEGRIPVDRTLQVVVEMWGNQAAPQQTGDSSTVEVPLCGFCEEQPATRRCVQCSGVLCEECEKTSHSKGFFKTHNIVDLDCTAQDQSLNHGRRLFLCDEHQDEKLSFYCLDCRRPVCSHCLILGEHKGHQQTPIDQAFETGKETLGAWVEKLKQRLQSTEDLLEQLRVSETEVNRGAEAQRNIINHEMDHLRELIETKRHQLLSKSALEEKQKRAQLQGQKDRAESARQDTTGLVNRSQDLLSLSSEHTFLAVVLPLIQDMKKCAGQPVDDAPRVSTLFRPLSTDAQVRSLGDLDLGHPRPPQQHVSAVQTMVGQGATSLMQAGQLAMDGQQPLVMAPGYGMQNATLSYLPQQAVPMQQVQYVYRTVTTQ